MIPECPRCHIPAPSSQAQFCPRCGGPLAKKPAKPIMLEKPGTLLNVWVGASLAVVLGGAALASAGQMTAGAVVLAVGLLLLLMAVVRNHSRRG